MTPELLRLWLPQVCVLARRAGARIAEIYAACDYAVEKKSDGSPVTTADRAADALIISGLRRLTPALPVVTEETLAELPFERRGHWRDMWLVDPLDGTREFVARTGEFSVNIALVRDGEPVLGVVAAPLLDTVWFGGVGLWAWKWHAGHQTLIRVQPPQRGCRVAVSRRHGRRADDFIASLPQPVTPVHMGSAIKICLVAEGSADYYPRFGPTSYWDTAAGHAILRAAGGEIRDLDGVPLRYLPDRTLENPFFIAQGAVPWPENVARFSG